MKKKTLILSLILALAIAVFVTGCAPKEAPAVEAPVQEVEQTAPVEEEEEQPQEPALSGEIMIAAAASLQNAIEGELIPLFNETNPDVTVIGTYDSSGKLQTQIEEGLDAQLFFSAAAKQMNALIEGGFIGQATVVDLLENEVVLITGIDSGTSVTGYENILDAASIAIGDPGSVPAGQYAQEILTSLGSWDAVNAMSSHGTNVTEVLNWVAEGSAEVGIVYKTDAIGMADKVKIIAPAPAGSLETPVIYPVGLQTELGDKAEVANAFMSFLQSPEAAKVFESYGFKMN